MFALTNKVAIVTGASSGIGRATAILFAEQGAQASSSRRGARPSSTRWSRKSPMPAGEAVALAGDVRDEAFAKALVERAVAEYGGLDIAFNNAGIVGAMGPVSGLSLEDWRETLDTNLTSAFLGAKYQVPAMIERGGGSLIFTSTFVGHTVGMPGMTAYAASKAGLIGLTQVLAAEFGAQGRPRQRAAAGRHRHAGQHHQRAGRRSRGAGLRRGPARAEADGAAGGDRALGAVPGVGRVELHDGHCAAGGWRGVDQPDVTIR